MRLLQYRETNPYDYQKGVDEHIAYGKGGSRAVGVGVEFKPYGYLDEWNDFIQKVDYNLQKFDEISRNNDPKAVKEDDNDDNDEKDEKDEKDDSRKNKDGKDGKNDPLDINGENKAVRLKKSNYATKYYWMVRQALEYAKYSPLVTVEVCNKRVLFIKLDKNVYYSDALDSENINSLTYYTCLLNIFLSQKTFFLQKSILTKKSSNNSDKNNSDGDVDTRFIGYAEGSTGAWVYKNISNNDL